MGNLGSFKQFSSVSHKKVYTQTFCEDRFNIAIDKTIYLSLEDPPILIQIRDWKGNATQPLLNERKNHVLELVVEKVG